MSKYGIINLIDKLFITVATFLVIYAWINFYLSNLWVTFFLSLIFTLAIVFILFYFLSRRNDKKIASKKQIEEINKAFFNFRLMPQKKRLELVKKILEIDNKVCELKTRLEYFKEDIKHIVIIATHIEKISQNDLINLIDEFSISNAKEVDIICNEVLSSVNENIFVDKKIKFITKEKLYFDFFNKYNIYPNETNTNQNLTKFNFKNFLKNLFIPAKAKNYFLCGLILIFSSIILPYHIYYLIFGSLLMIFSILSKIMPKIAQKK